MHKLNSNDTVAFMCVFATERVSLDPSQHLLCPSVHLSICLSVSLCVCVLFHYTGEDRSVDAIFQTAYAQNDRPAALEWPSGREVKGQHFYCAPNARAAIEFP